MIRKTHLKLPILALGLSLALAAAQAQAQDKRMRTMLKQDSTTEDVVRSLVPVGVDDNTEVSVSAPVTFQFDSDKLTNQARTLLDRIAEALKAPELNPYRFMIEGHTDATGNTSYNQELSERRARSVHSYLSYRGVDVTRLALVGFGETRLLPNVDPYDGLNRRVEVVRMR